MERIEESQKECLYEFTSHVFALLIERKDDWLLFIKIVGTIDALCSLSRYSFS